MAERTPYVASEHGARLDADLEAGGGTDDTAVLQALLDRAPAEGGIHLIVDGPARVTGLDVHANTTIEGTPHAGLYLADGSERALLRNANPTRGEVVDENITLRRLILNGNREGQRERYRGEPRPGELGVAVAGAPHLDRQHTLKAPVQFFGMRGLRIEHVALRNARTFSLWIANISDVVITEVWIDAEYGEYPADGTREAQLAFLSGPSRTNIDGIHINGPARDILIENVRITSEDDAISLCANDWGVADLTVHDLHGPHVGQGPITDVVVRNAVIHRASHGIRLLSADQRIDRILFEDVTGTIRERSVMISHFGIPEPVGDFGEIAFHGLRLEALPSLSIGDRLAESGIDVRGLDGVTGEEAESPFIAINSPVERLELRDVTVSPVDDRPLLRLGPDARVESLIAEITVAGEPGWCAPVTSLPGARLGAASLSLSYSGKRP